MCAPENVAFSRGISSSLLELLEAFLERPRNEDPERGTMTKISPDYRRLWARTFIDHEDFPRIPETLGEDVHRGAIAQTGERWCGLRTRIQSEDRLRRFSRDPQPEDRIPRIQDVDLERGSIAKIFSALVGRGRRSRV